MAPLRYALIAVIAFAAGFARVTEPTWSPDGRVIGFAARSDESAYDLRMFRNEAIKEGLDKGIINADDFDGMRQLPVVWMDRERLRRERTATTSSSGSNGLVM